MLKQNVFIFVLALAMLSLETGTAAQINVERDTRIVGNSGSLDIAAISAQTDQTWVVAEVNPSVHTTV